MRMVGLQKFTEAFRLGRKKHRKRSFRLKKSHLTKFTAEYTTKNVHHFSVEKNGKMQFTATVD